MALIPKTYMDSVVSIGVQTQDGKVTWIGTGFIAAKPVNSHSVQLMMITNKHVLNGQSEVVIRLCKKDSHDLISVKMPLIGPAREKLYSIHPDNDVDVAAVLLVGSYLEKNNLEVSAIHMNLCALTSSEYLEAGGDEGSRVFMLGFPMGLVDIDSKMPICRGGCIARMEANEIARSKNMLLDIQNFPGNSGSPIISCPEIISITGTKALSEAKLIGIIHSYIPYQESLINSQTHNVVEIRSENSGIAKANPVEYINEVMELEMIRLYGTDYKKKFADDEKKLEEVNK